MAHHPKKFLEHYSNFSLETHLFHVYQCPPGTISRARERFLKNKKQAIESSFTGVKKLIADLEEVLQQNGFAHSEGIQEFDEVAKQDNIPIGYELIMGRDYENDSDTVHLFFRGIYNPEYGRQMPDVLDLVALVHSKEHESTLAEQLEPLMVEYGLERKTDEDEKEEVQPQQKDCWLIQKLKYFREKRRDKKRSQARREFYQEASTFIIDGSKRYESFIATSEDYKATLAKLKRNYETRLTKEDMIDIADRVILDSLNNNERNAFLNGALRICKIDKPPVEVRYSERYKLLIEKLTNETVTP